MSLLPQKGRGTSLNPKNRFVELYSPLELNEVTCDDPSKKTKLYYDNSKTIFSYNDSPDVGFNVGLNPYRGCEHGCVYCFARPSHEYLGFSSGLDFESSIVVKKNAPELLKKELSSPSWQPQPIAFSGNTDIYQPIERYLKITRRCLEVLVEFRNPVVIITKSYLVTRDIDLLKILAHHKAVSVFVSVTTLDDHLWSILEPRSPSPRQRLSAIYELSQAGIPTGVLVAPIIPAINDHEIPQILKAASQHGAKSAGHVLLRLPYAVKDLFLNWLEKHFPDRKQKVINRIFSLRGGKLNDATFGKRMSGEGIFADQINQLFEVSCKQWGLNQRTNHLSVSSFKRDAFGQMNLFEV